MRGATDQLDLFVATKTPSYGDDFDHRRTRTRRSTGERIERAPEEQVPCETLLWGKRKTNRYYEVKLRCEGGRWFACSDYSMPNMGGGGPFSDAGASREGALVHVLRAKLAQIARHLAAGSGSVFHGKESEWRDLARWCIEQAQPPIFGGPDLAAEFEEAIATYRARDKLRCAAIRAGAREYQDERGMTLSIYSL